MIKETWEDFVKEYVNSDLVNYEFIWEYKGIEYYLYPINDVAKIDAPYEFWNNQNQNRIMFGTAYEALITAIISDGKTTKDLFEQDLINMDISY